MKASICSGSQMMSDRSDALLVATGGVALSYKVHVYAQRILSKIED